MLPFSYLTLYSILKSRSKKIEIIKEKIKRIVEKKVVSIYLGNVCIVENLTTITAQLVWHKLLMRTASQYSMCVCFTIYLYLSFFFPFFFEKLTLTILPHTQVWKREN